MRRHRKQCDTRIKCGMAKSDEVNSLELSTQVLGVRV